MTCLIKKGKEKIHVYILHNGQSHCYTNTIQWSCEKAIKIIFTIKHVDVGSSKIFIYVLKNK